MTDETWAPMTRHEWPEHVRLTEPEGDTVRVVGDFADAYPLPAVDKNDEAAPARSPRPSSLAGDPHGPARLIYRPSAVDHRATAVQAFNETARLAVDALDLPKTGARDWARSLGYDAKSKVVRAIDEAVAAIHEAIDLIDAAENG